MQLHDILAEERAVSPVIGVILMVAITVILAAVVGSFVFGIGGQVRPAAPNANFQFEHTDTGGDFNVTATHNGGETIPAAESLNLTSPSTSVAFSGAVSAGTSQTLQNVQPDTTVRVVWMDENGENSAVLATDTTPA